MLGFSFRRRVPRTRHCVPGTRCAPGTRHCVPHARLDATRARLDSAGFGKNRFEGVIGRFLMTSWAVLVPLASGLLADEQWLGFRGDGTNAAEVAGPEKLSGDDAPKFRWKTDMPGDSVAGPIVVGDQVISSSSGGQDGEVLFITSVSLADGHKLWQQQFQATGRPYCHPTSANAAPTAVSDGERIVVLYSSNDLVCVDRTGKLIWLRGLAVDYPKLGNDIGLASSPIIADGVVIVQVECQGAPLAVGVDLQTGKNLWKIDRPSQSNWASPVAIKRTDGSTDVVLQSRSGVSAIDPKTGNPKWELDEGFSAVSSPTPTDKLLILPGDQLVALNYAESATQPEEVWRASGLTPQSASAVVGGGRVYSLKGSVLVAGDLATGEKIWNRRLGKLRGTWATPVLAGKRLYVFDQSGKGVVVEDTGDEGTVVDEVELPSGVLGSPAMVDGKLVVRTRDSLYCF
ncbi:MAG: PQQ-binding-like beta-propeller repeat protein [Planctomycetota bacterium]